MATIRQACIGEGCCPCEQSCYHAELGFTACFTPNVAKCYESANNAKTAVDWEVNYTRDYIGVDKTRSWNLGVHWSAVPAGLTAQATALGRTIHYLVFTLYNADTPSGVTCSSSSAFGSTQPAGGATNAKCPSIIGKNFITRVTAPGLTQCPWTAGSGGSPTPPRGPRIPRSLNRTNLHDWNGDCDPHKLPNVMLWVVANNGTYNDTGYNAANDLLLAQVVVCVSRSECSPATGADVAFCCQDPELLDGNRCHLESVGKSLGATPCVPAFLFPSTITVAWDGSNSGSMTLSPRFPASPACFYYSSWDGTGIPPNCIANVKWKGKGKCDPDGATTGVWRLEVLSLDVIVSGNSYTDLGLADITGPSDRRYPYDGVCTITLDNYNPEGCFGDADETVNFTIEA